MRVAGSRTFCGKLQRGLGGWQVIFACVVYARRYECGGGGRANCWISLVTGVSKCTGVGVMHAWCYTCAEYLHAYPRAFQVLREA